MDKNIIKDLSKRFYFSNKKAIEVYDEFLKTPSVIAKDNKSEFLKICLTTHSPLERLHKVQNFLSEEFAEDYINRLCNLIFGDVFINIMINFNILDYFGRDDFRKELRKKLKILKIEKHLNFQLINKILGMDSENPEEKVIVSIIDNLYLSRDYLESDKLISLISSSVIDNKNDEKYENFKPYTNTSILKKVGIIGFRLEGVRKNCLEPFLKDLSILEQLKWYFGDEINKPISSKVKFTNLGYWRIFIFVEYLKNVGYKPKDAYEEVSKYLDSKYVKTTIRTRYFAKKKEAREKNMNFMQILKEFNLISDIFTFISDLNLKRIYVDIT